MAKNLIIATLMIIIIALLVYTAVKPPATITIPVQQPAAVDRGEPTPRAPEIITPLPTPKADETEELPRAGIPAEIVYPQEVNFWVNAIRVPGTTAYQEGLNYIPVKKNDIKTFAGSFGPYPIDPTTHIKVILCAEFSNMPAAPACETVPVIYRENWVSFAKGYQYDEYIGAMAAKDYTAYYDVYIGNTRVASSNKAVIRTIKN